MAAIVDIIISIILSPVKLVQFIGKKLGKVGDKFGKLGESFTNGCLWLCIKVYHFFRYAFIGVTLPISLLFSLLGKIYLKLLDYQNQAKIKREEEMNRRDKIKQEKRAKKLAAERAKHPEKYKEKEKKKLTPEQEKLKGLRLDSIIKPEKVEPEKEKPATVKEAVPKDDFVYISDDYADQKKGIGDHINDVLEKIFNIPKSAYEHMKKSFEESTVMRQAKNKKDINRQALMIDFEGADAEKEEKKVMWEYVCRNPEGKTVKGYFAAYSRLEVHSFLMSEGMTVYSIRTNKWIQTMYSSVNGNGAKMKRKDLIFFLTQLSTYVKSGIPLVESMNILTRQFKNKNYQRMFRSMMYDLTMGESFSKAMENQGNSFPAILINMVKSSELTGELPEALDDMAEYFSEMEKTHKEMVSALTYPTIVFMMAIGVTIFMMVYIVPQFVEIYESMDSSAIPKFTLMVMAASDFMKHNLLSILFWVVVVIIIVLYCYRNIKILRTLMQWILMHIPVVGSIIIYKEVMMFSKTFASLLSHNVFITDSMNILKKITNNEIYKIMILDTVNNLASGEKISTAFKDHWAFPVPAYEMIVTGEKTGQLAEMMAKVADYYQDEHKNMVARVKSLMEPIIIVFLTAIVGTIVLAIVIPMFSMYSQVSSMAG